MNIHHHIPNSSYTYMYFLCIHTYSFVIMLRWDTMVHYYENVEIYENSYVSYFKCNKKIISVSFSRCKTQKLTSRTWIGGEQCTKYSCCNACKPINGTGYVYYIWSNHIRSGAYGKYGE